jgi:hypothetical protein
MPRRKWYSEVFSFVFLTEERKEKGWRKVGGGGGKREEG